MSNKTYILQKDLPDAEVGDEYFWNGYDGYSNYDRTARVIAKEWVEETGWFKEKKEERIGVKIIGKFQTESTEPKQLLQFKTSADFPPEKMNAIKNAIERILNSEVTQREVVADYLIREAEEKAFEAGRSGIHGYDLLKQQYPTFEDYKSSKTNTRPASQTHKHWP